MPAMVCSTCLLAGLICTRDRASPLILGPRSSEQPCDGCCGEGRAWRAQRPAWSAGRPSTLGCPLRGGHLRWTLPKPSAPRHRRFRKYTVTEIFARWIHIRRPCRVHLCRRSRQGIGCLVQRLLCALPLIKRVIAPLAFGLFVREGGRKGRWEGETKESRESESLEQLNGGFFL